MPKPDAELQLDQFIGKFSKDMGKLISAARSKMRPLMPRALELIYDNYNFFVIAYGPSEKAGDTLFSLAAQAKGLSLYFLQGAKLPDPHKLLRGSGNVVRSISLASADTLDDPKSSSVDGRRTEACAIADPGRRQSPTDYQVCFRQIAAEAGAAQEG
jgi:hypothetical protein